MVITGAPCEADVEVTRCPAPEGAEARAMTPVLPARRAEIAELYTRYGSTVLSRCRYLLRDEEAARDAAHEVFVKVMRALDELRNDASPVTWILKIATNHCLNVIASNRAKWHERFRRYREHEEATREIGVAVEKAKMVRDLLEKLDEETQAIAVFYYVDELTQDEIAAATGRSLPTIRKRLEKFQRIAKRELGDDL